MEGEADPARDVVSLHPTSPAEPVVVYHDQSQLAEQLEEEETVWSNSVSDERRAMTSWVISQRRAYGRRTSIWERSLSLPAIEGLDVLGEEDSKEIVVVGDLGREDIAEILPIVLFLTHGDIIRIKRNNPE